MCFSATASFASSAILFPIGIFSLIKMWHSTTKLLAFAPFIFGIQQFSEGIVWTGFNLNNAEMIKIASYFYLFFAYSLWPIFIPICAYQLEKKFNKKNILKNLIVLGGLLSIFLSVTLFVFHDLLHIYVVHHSIQYETSQSSIVHYGIQLYYFLICFLPCFLSCDKRLFFFSGMILFSFGITVLFYNYAYTSVSCFYAALISLLIPVLFIKNK